MSVGLSDTLSGLSSNSPKERAEFVKHVTFEDPSVQGCEKIPGTVFKDDIIPRKIPPQNILCKLRDRELNLRRRGGSGNRYAYDFYQSIYPNCSILNVGRPPCYLRKFTPDGRYFLGFSVDQNHLEIFRYNGPCSASEYLSTAENGEFVHNTIDDRLRLFYLFFTLKFRVAMGEPDYQLHRECSLFTSDNRYVIVACTNLVSEDRVPFVFDAHRTNETPMIRYPLENIILEIVELEAGIVTDRINFPGDKIMLSHNAGLYIFEDIFAVLSLQQQVIHIYKITPSGTFVPIRKVGRFCFDDDELLLASTLTLRENHHPYEEKCLGALKQRIMSHLFRRAVTMEDKRKFAKHFDLFANMKMWKMQLLDKNHLLIKYASEEGVTNRRPEQQPPNYLPVSATPTFFVVYEMTEAKVLGVYENCSQEFLAIFEKYSGFFFASHTVASPNVSVCARKNYYRWKQTMTSPKYGGAAEATRRLLAQLPISAQSHAISPYLDVDLFSYDEKYVSQFERPKTSSEAPIRFYAKDSGFLRFRIHAGLTRNMGIFVPQGTKKLVAFAFHPSDPFAISILRTHNDYIINLHVRRCAV